MDRRLAAAAAALVPTGVVGVGAPLLLRSRASKARLEITAIADGQVWPEAARGVVAGVGEPLRLVLLGDSSAVGLGASGPEDTAGLRLLRRLAAEGQAATLDVLAVSGAVSDDLDAQVDQALAIGAQVAVISIGANDITHRVAPRRSARALASAIGRLRQSGIEVVVATAPDLGAVARLARPLRWWAGAASRRTWHAQTRACARTGAAAVPVGKLLGHAFATDPGMFSADGFHPSSYGYGAVADALWPAVCAAVRAVAGGLPTDHAGTTPPSPPPR